MDIKYKDDKVEISIKNINKNSILVDSELNSVVKIIEILRDFNGEIRTGLTNIIKDTKQEEKEIKTKDVKDNERPVVRERIPNKVDLSDYEIKSAVTTEPMIRCPCCGQSSKAIVHIDNEFYYLRKSKNKNKETFDTIMVMQSEEEVNNIIKPEDSDILDYHHDIMDIKIPSKLKNTDLNVDNNTELLCPICNETKKFNEWVDAYNNPLDYFETDMLCDICGGEAVEKINKDKTKVIICECCGYEKPVI